MQSVCNNKSGDVNGFINNIINSVESAIRGVINPTKGIASSNKEKGIDMSESEIRDNIAKRDYNDMHKKVGALKKTDDQIYIDTSNMTIDEVVNKIVNIVKEGN